MLFDLVGFFIFRNQVCFVSMSVVDVSLCEVHSSNILLYFDFLNSTSVVEYCLRVYFIQRQLVIATFRALCAISKRQTAMSQILLICENNIMQLSLFHIQDIKDSMSLFNYLYL